MTPTPLEQLRYGYHGLSRERLKEAERVLWQRCKDAGLIVSFHTFGTETEYRWTATVRIGQRVLTTVRHLDHLHRWLDGYRAGIQVAGGAAR